jgi:hypothetical protein
LSQPPAQKQSRRLRNIVAVSVAATILIVASFAYVESSDHPTSICSTFPQDAEGANAGAAKTGLALYDQQEFLILGRNSTSMDYNVTAIAQNDSYGFGPYYIVNGLTDRDFWYQVGISWNPGITYSTHRDGFYAFFEVWNASEGISVFPVGGTGGVGNFSGAVHSGDVISLQLSFASGNVTMQIHDIETGAVAAGSYFAYGATYFAKSGSSDSYPTSLLTEWYHVLPYFCSNERVVFSSPTITSTPVTISLDEWNFTCTSCSAFNQYDGQELVFAQSSPGISPVGSEFHGLTADGTSAYVNGSEFVTP